MSCDSPVPAPTKFARQLAKLKGVCLIQLSSQKGPYYKTWLEQMTFEFIIAEVFFMDI